MKAKLKSLKEFEARSKKNDCRWLLKNILSTMLQFDKKRNGYLAILDADQNFLNCMQSPEQTTEEYLENPTLWADTTKEYHGGTFVEIYRLASGTGPDGPLGPRKNVGARRETRPWQWPSSVGLTLSDTGSSSPSYQISLLWAGMTIQLTSIRRTACW
jgi:hypothetical protein